VRSFECHPFPVKCFVSKVRIFSIPITDTNSMRIENWRAGAILGRIWIRSKSGVSIRSAEQLKLLKSRNPHEQRRKMVGTRRLELLTSTVSSSAFPIPITTYRAYRYRQVPINACWTGPLTGARTGVFAPSFDAERTPRKGSFGFGNAGRTVSAKKVPALKPDDINGGGGETDESNEMDYEISGSSERLVKRHSSSL
jgi:hypothetical protein